MGDGPAILVTGGAGYIGSHGCRALRAAGYQPVVFDNFSTGHRSFVAGPLVAGDLTDRATLDRAFAEHKIVAVMHFAAASLVGESVIDPQKYYANNVAGTLSLLEAMRDAGCNRLVFSSTGAVYGNADSKALPETYPCAPINPYGASKWMIERILADYRAAYGLGAFCLRYFNASGADPSGGIGELRENETHLIPRAMMALQGHCRGLRCLRRRLRHARRHRDPRLHPRHRPRGGACRRAEAADAGTCRRRFNLGTGNGFSVREILRRSTRDRPGGSPCRQAAAAGDPAYLVADPTARARR